MVAALLATSSAFVAGYQVVGSRVAEVQGSRVAAPARTPTMVVADKWSQKQRDASRYASFAFAPEGLDLDSDEGFTYEELAASMGDIKKYARGDSATGTVVSFEPNGAVVDIGVKSSAYCSLTEMALTKPDKPEFVFSIGDTCEFVVMSREDENGQLFLSRRRILFQEAWDKVPPPSPSLSACPVLPPAHPPPLLTPLTPTRPHLSGVQADPPPQHHLTRHLQKPRRTASAPPVQVTVVHSEDGVVEAEVMAVNKGGAMLQVEGLRAFMPGSHYLPGQTPTEALVGQTLKVRRAAPGASVPGPLLTRHFARAD
jgi:hypothetical protein